MDTTSTVIAEGTAARVTRRALLVRDGITFLALLLSSLALYGVTFFLFRSFEAHRDQLAVRWSERGRAELAQGHPTQAITALRAALSYAPDEQDYQLLLAQALAGAGRTEEASNYFLNLWEARPGDGFINLELARLERQRGDTQQAIDYYRASIYGGWQSNGLEVRRNVRLELADYLVRMHDPLAARAELLISAANTPDSPASDLMLGDRLAQTGDLPDALSLYRKAIADDPHSRLALEKAGGTAYNLGDYVTADRLLHRALQAKQIPGQGLSETELVQLAHDSSRLLELSLSRDLPARVRADHLRVASRIAQARLSACTAQLVPDAPATLEPSPGKPTTLTPPAPALPIAAEATPLLDLRARWKLATAPANEHQMLTDAATQDSMTDLINETELQTATSCGPPTGDDALLLKMARASTSNSDRP